MSRRRQPGVQRRRRRLRRQRCRGDPRTRPSWILRSVPDPIADPDGTPRRRRFRWLDSTRGLRHAGWAEAAPDTRCAGQKPP